MRSLCGTLDSNQARSSLGGHQCGADYACRRNSAGYRLDRRRGSTGRSAGTYDRHWRLWHARGGRPVAALRGADHRFRCESGSGTGRSRIQRGGRAHRSCRRPPAGQSRSGGHQCGHSGKQRGTPGRSAGRGRGYHLRRTGRSADGRSPWRIDCRHARQEHDHRADRLHASPGRT